MKSRWQNVQFICIDFVYTDWFIYRFPKRRYKKDFFGADQIFSSFENYLTANDDDLLMANNRIVSLVRRYASP